MTGTYEDSFHDDEPDTNEDERGDMLDLELGAIPAKPPLCVPPETRVADVIREMNERSTGCALVVDGKKLVGIFTERDVLRKVAAGTVDARTVAVSTVMTRDPDALPADASVAFALNRMTIEGYRHIPIVDESGHAVGVVGMRDIITWLVDSHPNEVLTVPPAPSSVPRAREGA